MKLALRKPMTLEEFLAWEEGQPLRYEFDGFQPVAMTGGTFIHAAIQRNLLFALRGLHTGAEYGDGRDRPGHCLRDPQRQHGQ